jgi:hypothetical protein
MIPNHIQEDLKDKASYEEINGLLEDGETYKSRLAELQTNYLDEEL